VLTLFSQATGHAVSAVALVPSGAGLIPDITLKAYPAQYALQPIIAAGAHFAANHARRIAEIDRIQVRVSQRTVFRTADRAKFRPASAEAADHSLPFSLAVAMLDGMISPESLENGRWRADDVLAVMDRIEVEPIATADEFGIGHQEVDVTFQDGTVASLPCRFPGDRS